MYLGRMCWPRFALVLFTTGMAGVLNGTAGPWVHRGITALAGAAGHFVGRWTGLGLAVLLAVAHATASAILLWRDKGKLDNRTAWVVATLPATVMLIPGPVGTAATTAVGIIPAAAGHLIAAGFGW